uniref:Ribosome assembly factor mrt4 n=1 Tax=Entomoneis paludosa TaxID=265537 RepID=A0A7S2VG84_9STRA|mmetsp:Transcript_17330/g.35913  ORF Transcript_17330/g.35913 Transcript_17330/m.35913 type:complete len:225 (+) Transcript_17330:83-757(+)
MPKSKRVREVALTQTDKRATRDHKSKYIEEVRDAVDKHESIYLFSYENMRSSQFKNVRMHFRGTDSRIFLGKNKLLQIALGRSAEEEYADNLQHMAKRITGGSVGLLFTSRERATVEEYFANLREPDFARAGAVAERAVEVTNGDLEQFPVSMMEQLRKAGMPVEIKLGKIVIRDGHDDRYSICSQGQVLTADKCKLLVHFGYKLSTFKVDLLCRWAGGDFEEL